MDTVELDQLELHIDHVLHYLEQAQFENLGSNF